MQLYSQLLSLFLGSPEKPNRNKRHGDDTAAVTDSRIKEMKKLMKNRKGVRCSHILAPLISPGTPVITDLNGDGKFEAVVSVVYSALSAEYGDSYFNFMHPPKIVVQTFNIERRLKALYGVDINVDTSVYYPLDEQPWTGYMGRTGNGTFITPN